MMTAIEVLFMIITIATNSHDDGYTGSIYNYDNDSYQQPWWQLYRFYL